MTKNVRSSDSLPKNFMIFIAMMALLSVFGGYQLHQLMYGAAGSTLQRTDQILFIEENLDDAAIELGRQIQEWKDMLLRANDKELYNKHRKAFLDSSIGVQKALLLAKAAVQNGSLDTDEIEQLRVEHKSLFSNYLLAQSRLEPDRIESSREVDKRIIGMDRDLQRHIATVKSDIGSLAKRQLNGAIPKLENQYLLISLLGAISLLLMSLFGVIFASYFQGYETTISERHTAS